MYRKQDYDLLSSVELVKSSHEVGDKVAIGPGESEYLDHSKMGNQPTYVILEKGRLLGERTRKPYQLTEGCRRRVYRPIGMGAR